MGDFHCKEYNYDSYSIICMSLTNISQFHNQLHSLHDYHHSLPKNKYIRFRELNRASVMVSGILWLSFRRTQAQRIKVTTKCENCGHVCGSSQSEEKEETTTASGAAGKGLSCVVFCHLPKWSSGAGVVLYYINS